VQEQTRMQILNQPERTAEEDQVQPSLMRSQDGIEMEHKEEMRNLNLPIGE